MTIKKTNYLHMKKEFKLESKGLKVLQGGYLFPQALCQALLRHEKIKM